MVMMLARRSALLGFVSLVVARPSLGRPPAAVPLFDFAIAGGGYHGLPQARSGLSVGLRVMIKAEPGNPHDANAVAVLRADGLRLGYVPRSANPPVAALLAQGRRLAAELTAWLDESAWQDEALASTFFVPGDPRWKLELEQ